MKPIFLLLTFMASGLVHPLVAKDSASPGQETTKQSLQLVITNYLNLKNALTNDNASMARASATALYADLKDTPRDNLPLDLRKIWSHVHETLVEDASAIAGTHDIGKQRKQFATLSSNFYRMIKEMNINTVELFYQYCPMADAYWVSEQSKIVNPYYGKRMPACGSTKDTLKASN